MERIKVFNLRREVENLVKREFNFESGQSHDFEKAGDKMTMVRVEYVRNPKAKVSERQKEECAHRIAQGKDLQFYTGELIKVGRNKGGFWYITIRAQQRKDVSKPGFRYAYRALSTDKGTFTSFSRL